MYCVDFCIRINYYHFTDFHCFLSIRADNWSVAQSKYYYQTDFHCYLIKVVSCSEYINIII